MGAAIVRRLVYGAVTARLLASNLGFPEGPIVLRDGRICPWDTPGIGIEWDDAAVARHRA